MNPSTRMRAITIHQPYASATAAGVKLVENRSGGVTPYRGDVAIHAGLAWNTYGAADPLVMAWHDTRPGAVPTGLAGHVVRDAVLYPTGVVVAVARLVDCHRIRVLNDRVVCCRDPWALARLGGRPVRTHTVWEDVRVLPEPVRARGALGWWRLTEADTRAVLAQLESALSDPR